MTCETARNWLSQSDAPGDLHQAPENVASHVRACPTCRRWLDDLLHLEQSWRDRPLPAEATTSKQAFLRRINDLPQPHQPTPKPYRWKRQWFWATAAMVAIVVGALVLMYWPTQQQVQAHPDVLDQLVDWNLELTEAPTLNDRLRIFQEQHNHLKERIRLAALSEGDRELAQTLLSHGVRMAHRDDPVEELGQFHHLADRLLQVVELASDKGDAVRANRAAKQYAKVAARGIDGNLERMKVIPVVDPEKKKKVKQLLLEDQNRDAVLLVLVEKAPNATKKELKTALELSQKRHKTKKIDK